MPVITVHFVKAVPHVKCNKNSELTVTTRNALVGVPPTTIQPFILTFNLRKATIMTHTPTKGQGSLSSKVRVEINRWTDRRTEAIALPNLLKTKFLLHLYLSVGVVLMHRLMMSFISASVTL